MQQPRAGRSAIVAPGGGYGPDGPLLMYARLAVERRLAASAAVLGQVITAVEGFLDQAVWP